MPYKDPEKAKEARKRHYEANKDSYKSRARDRRSKVRKLIQSKKTNVPCSDCNIIYPYYVMDFDHLPDFEKSFSIAQHPGMSGNIEAVILEIEKCEVVCSNCHRQRSWNRQLGKSNPIGEGRSLENC